MIFNPFFSLQGPAGKTRPDNLKVAKSALRFGPLEMTRVNTVPPMNHGRPGDVVLIDNTDSPSIQLQTKQTPNAVGMWMKLPLGYASVPSGNLVSGYPMGFSTLGDVIIINGTPITLNAPNTATQAVVDILAAAIPNITAQVLGEAVILSEGAGGAITVTNQTGQPAQTLGLYSQPAIATFNPNGAWMPMAFAAASAGPAAPAAASYLTLANDPNLTDERILTAGVGINTVDNGTGGSLVIEQDINGVPPLSDPIDPADELLVWNASTGLIEKTTIAAINGGGVLATEAVQQRTVLLGTGTTTNLGAPLPAGAVVRRVLIEITSAYSAGTTIQIGDSGALNSLMGDNSNDPQEVNTFETTTVLQYAVATQVIATITGTPTAGAGRIVLDFILP